MEKSALLLLNSSSSNEAYILLRMNVFDKNKS